MLIAACACAAGLHPTGDAQAGGGQTGRSPAAGRVRGCAGGVFGGCGGSAHALLWEQTEVFEFFHRFFYKSFCKSRFYSVGVPLWRYRAVRYVWCAGRRWSKNSRPKSFRADWTESTHTERLALSSTRVCLTISGALCAVMLECNHAVACVQLLQRLLDVVFQGVCCTHVSACRAPLKRSTRRAHGGSIGSARRTSTSTLVRCAGLREGKRCKLCAWLVRSRGRLSLLARPLAAPGGGAANLRGIRIVQKCRAGVPRERGGVHVYVHAHVHVHVREEE